MNDPYMVISDLLMTLRLVQEQYAERGIELKEITRAIARGEAALQAAGNDPLKANHDALKQAFIEADPLPIEQYIEEQKNGTQVPLDPKLVQELADAMEAERAAGASYVGEPVLKTYSVTWRRPASAYAHDEIEATSIEDALMKAKTIMTSNRTEQPFFEPSDDYEGCDWISVEGDYTPGNPKVEHIEWEEPKLSPGKLMLALTTIMNRAKNMGTPGQSKGNMLQALQFIENIARCAIDESIPGEKE